MALIDHRAAQVLAQLREEAGHSPESLAADIRDRAEQEPWGARGAVDAWTIRQIERDGYVPGPRIRFVLGSYFGEPIWFIPPTGALVRNREKATA